MSDDFGTIHKVIQRLSHLIKGRLVSQKRLRDTVNANHFLIHSALRIDVDVQFLPSKFTPD